MLLPHSPALLGADQQDNTDCSDEEEENDSTEPNDGSDLGVIGQVVQDRLF